MPMERAYCFDGGVGTEYLFLTKPVRDLPDDGRDCVMVQRLENGGFLGDDVEITDEHWQEIVDVIVAAPEALLLLRKLVQGGPLAGLMQEASELLDRIGKGVNGSPDKVPVQANDGPPYDAATRTGMYDH